MKKTIIILLSCLFPYLTEAQQLVTLDQCRQMALENNKQTAIAGKTYEKAGYEVNAYRANFLPKFSANGGYLFYPHKFKENLYNIPLELDLNHTFMAGVQLEQPLYAGGKIRAAYRMASLSKEMAELNRELSRTEVLLQTDEAYWNCVRARELHQSALAYKEVVTELLRNVENAQAVGLRQKNDVLKVQVKLNDAELQIRRAVNAIRLSRMNLCHILGLPLDHPLIVSDSFPEADGMAIIPFDVSRRPEYGLLSYQKDLKHQETRLTRSDFLPSVGVMANYGYMDGLKLNGDKLLSSGNFSALVSVRIPLFEWGKGVNKVRSARVEEQIADLQQMDAVEKMTLEAAQALNALDEAEMEVRLTAHSLEQAEENMKLSKDMYDAGMETLADYLESQTIWQKARAEHIIARTSFQYNKTYYLKAVGKL